MKPLFKTEYKNKLVKIFVPIMLSNLISQIQMFIDRIFLGRMNILYMSAVGNVTAPIWTTMSFVMSLSIGASILISQSVGEKALDKAKEYAASMIKFSNVLPILLFFFWMICSPFVFRMMGVSPNVMKLCITYTRIYSPVFLIVGLYAAYGVVFQTSNYTKPLVTYGIIRSLLNIFLDYVLIFGKLGFPRMEIAGAALGTTIAEYVGALYLLYITITKRKEFFTSPGLKQILAAKFKPFIKSVKLGLPTACEDLLWNAGNLCIIRILNTINEVAAGIYSMVFTVEVIFVVVIGAIGNGTLTLTGEATGAKDNTLYRNIVKTSIKWAFMVCGMALVFVSLFPRFTLSLFTTDKEVIEMSVVYIILVAVNLFGKSGNIIFGNGIRGYGDTKWMMFTQTLGTIGVVGLAALCVFVFKLGMLGVFIAVLCDEGVRALINFVRFSKIKFSSLKLGRVFSIPELDKTGRVKALYTTANDTAWNYEDALAHENFIALSQQFGISLEDIVKSKQTHTDIVKVVTKQNGGDGILRPIDEANAYDGLITNEKNLLLCTVEADCVPVYFYDPVKEVIAMVHSGWKGTVKKISEVAIKKMQAVFGCDSQKLLVAIGPHICTNCYEVGQDVFEEFRQSFDQQDIEKIFTQKNQEKYLLNLEQAVKITLIKNGVLEKNIFSTDVCTLHSQKEGYNFCSYRRTKSKTERMLTAIMMR